MRSRTRAPNLTLVALTALWLTSCTGAAERDAGVPEDSGVAADAGFPDSGVATEDAGLPDTGVGEPDTGVVPDSGELPDSGEVTDSGELPDSGDIPDTGDVPDTGVDAGEVDGGDGDAGHVDAGAPDTGIPPDAGVPGVCTDGEEGCLCAFGQACNDPALTCFNTSGTNVPPAQRVNICLRECVVDSQCTASVVGHNICRPVSAGARACVSQERGEGQLADISRLRGPMRGCQIGLFAFPFSAGLSGLLDDQVSCGRPCNPRAVPGDPGACGPTYPYCNPGVLTSSATPGMCTLRRANPGDACSRTSVVGLCDTTTSTSGNGPDMACLGAPFDIQDPADPSPNPDTGICVLLCDLANPDCGNAHDLGAGSARCRQFTSANTTTGICSNECERWPSDCRNPGALGAGTTCTGTVQIEQGYPFSLCYGVMTPIIQEWNRGATPSYCLTLPGGEARCESGTYCFSESQVGASGLCVRTCNAALPAGAQGCQLSRHGFSVCDQTLINQVPGGTLGLCR